MSLADLLRRTSARFPEKTAIFYGDAEITYIRLDQEVDRLASGLINLGLQPGQMVGLLLGNSPDFVRSLFGITRAGGVVVPINPLYKGEEVKYLLGEAGVVLLITAAPFLSLVQGIWGDLPALKKVIAVGGKTEGRVVAWEELLAIKAIPVGMTILPEELAACLFTSGTTGKPKGALLTHGNFSFDLQAIKKRIDLKPEDRYLCVLPLFHSFALTSTVLCPVYTGGSMVILPQFRPDLVLEQIQTRRVTVFCGIPSMYAALLKLLYRQSYDLSSLRLCVSGGAPMPEELMRCFEGKCGKPIVEGDGPTETSPVAYVNPPDLRKPGSVGPPLDGVRVKIVDEADRGLPVNEIGEICIQGGNVMQGYLNQPEATAEALQGGWFHTGDLGKMDEDGYVYIIDRKKDMIIVGGLNVYPREIENCLQQHPKVAGAAVIGIPEELHGEVPAAFLVLKEGTEAKPEEFILYCRKHLANFKCPRRVVLVKSLPKTVTGKVDKKLLRREYGIK